MRKILIINGHEFWPHSEGRLNKFITEETKSFFEALGDAVKTTNIDDDWDVKEEVEKYLWANVIIYVTPVYWFDIPARFKMYIEKVFSGGKPLLFKDDGRSDGGKYGSGGLMHTTRYMLMTTWNAPEEAFNNPISSPLFENKSVDDVFLHFHSAQKFIGMKKIPGLHFFDVKKNPDIEKFKKNLYQHLNFNFNFK